jgi:periplasmic protein CpxP/Spy
MEDIVLRKFTTLAVLLLATAPAFAQAPAPAAPIAPAPKAADPGAEARVDQRIKQMHQRLKITPAQESAWDAFAQQMRKNVTSTVAAYNGRRASIATMSAVENMQNFAQIEQARTQGIQDLAGSFQALYGMLSDDQKQTADAMFRHYEDRAAPPRKAPK